MASKLSQLRQGVPPNKTIEIRGMKVAVIVVSSDITRQCEELTEEYSNNNKDKCNERVKGQYFDTLLSYHCMRDCEDPTLQAKIADSAEEVAQLLDIDDINKVTTAYGELLMNKSKLELMSEEDYEDIKKFLEVTPLNDLDTVSLVHLTNFHQTIVSEI